jgi:hypothetical protein
VVIPLIPLWRKSGQSYPFKPEKFPHIRVDVYIDESGDIGFSERSSPFFVIIALIVHEPHQVERCFSKIRKNRLKKKYRELPELKFNNSDKVIKRRVLECLAQSNIEFWCSVLRKKQVYDYLQDKPQIVYNYLAGSLIAKIYEYYWPFSEMNVIVDKSLNGIQKDLFDQYVANKTMEQNSPLFYPDVPPTILHKDSRREPCIQAADFIAGAVHRKYRQADESCYFIIQNKCLQIFDYFEGPQKRL